MTRIVIVACALVCLVALTASAAVRGKDAMYVGGTIADIGEKTKGQFDLSNEEVAVFITEKGKQQARIPYKGIKSLEYGQKAGRRVGVAIAVTPFALFSKKRKHYLSITYVDEQGSEQGVVFELAKGITRATLETFETRSGVEIEYESEEAKKNVP